MAVNRTYLAISAIGLALAATTAFSSPGAVAPVTAPTAPVSPVPAPAAPAPATIAEPAPAADAVTAAVSKALSAFASVAPRLSHDEALEMAFRAYYAYAEAHPEKARKPYLYFVDYGLSSTKPRGYVFDMKNLKVVDGPFAVAHGRGSLKQRDGVPNRFSNVSGSATSSLGLFVGAELYAFTGHAGGVYHSTGLRMDGVSGRFNSAARVRRVVAHGAPYVTPTGSGRSEGCPAMEPARAKRLLPLIADGGLVFLFSPVDRDWMENDPWAAE